MIICAACQSEQNVFHKRADSGMLMQVVQATPEPPQPPAAILSIRPLSGASIEFVRVPPGTFKMGSEAYMNPKLFFLIEILVGHGSGQPNDEGPIRTTTITNSFYLGRTKITATQYCEFLNDIPGGEQHIVFNGWEHITKTDDGRFLPKPGLEDALVNTVPWNSAVAYCNWLSEKTGLCCRLPTEAEWEWAARGPEGRLFPWGDAAEAKVDYGYKHEGGPMIAFDAPANATPLGIYDMIGPTAEWCNDWYGDRYEPDDRVDPQGPGTGMGRVMRGRGSEATDRHWHSQGRAGVQGGLYGFRVLIDTKQSTCVRKE